MDEQRDYAYENIAFVTIMLTALSTGMAACHWYFAMRKRTEDWG